MIKDYLDALYERREDIRTDLGMARDCHDFPDDGYSVQVNAERVKYLTRMLSLQDQNIADYLATHRAI